ncbi:hypothetical protein [Nocardia xishanensis]|uniref:hypothetical protein n=1 Tax=Nocardia xishanensis TaxID=238964 RepID=UPI000A4C6D8F|nr:hypothetical protein [Nocardia xishanensis]
MHGTAVIETVTLGGVAVPDVPVSVHQMRPCDTAERDILSNAISTPADVSSQSFPRQPL